MKRLRLLGLFAFASTLIVLASSGPGISRSKAMPDLPAPHLGYGFNIRHNLDMADGLGFDWIKLYEDLYPSPDDFPAKAAQYHVLYRVKAEGQPFSLDVYLAHVQQLVLAGRGKVKAYEIGNERNLGMFWGGANTNPAQHWLDAILAAYPTKFPCLYSGGYHPQDFPYPPEISYEELEQQHPDDNGN